MNKFKLADMIKKNQEVDKETFMMEQCAGKTVLDLGCIRHSAQFSLKDPHWLHQKIKDVAKKTVGVDYLTEEIAKINAHGYEVIHGDVTKPLSLTEQFDVIVAGDILEHLVNFEGFFLNCRVLLKPEGILIITTPNPFFAGEFHYVSFKRNFIVNPEHTCWIDPQCLAQLSERFKFKIEKIAYIKSSWRLEELICETDKHSYDITEGRWGNNTIFFKAERKFMKGVFGVFYFLYKVFTGTNSPLCRYSDYLAVLKTEQDH